MTEQQPWKDELTSEEVAKLEKIGERVTEYYSQPADRLPPADGDEHEEGLILKDIIEKRLKKD